MVVSVPLALIAGCSAPGPAARPADPPTPTEAPDLVLPDFEDPDVAYAAALPTHAIAGPAPLTPTVLQVEVEESGTWRVEYGKETFDSVTPEITGTRVDLRGLEADTAYRWRVVGTDEDGNTRVSAEQWYVVPPAPAIFPRIQLEVEGDPGFEYLLATMAIEPAGRSAAVILDKKGNFVWWVLGDSGLSYVTPQLTVEGGEPVVGWVQTDHDMEEDLGKLVHVPVSGAWRRETRLPMGHHDVVQHEDGTLAFLAYTFRYRWLDWDWTHMVSDQIRVGRVGQDEADPTELVFDQFDDFPIRTVESCDHVQNVETTTFGVEHVQEWTHANSLLYVPEDDTYVVNDKYTDWMFAVGRRDGRVRWILNGLHGTFTNPDGTEIWRAPRDTDLWSHAHTSQVWHGGAMMFDNGDHREPPASRVMEVAWDTDTRIAEAVWVHDHPEGAFAQALGDAHKLPDDRVLVTWAAAQTVEVVTRDHVTDWRIRVNDGAWIGRVVPLDSLY